MEEAKKKLEKIYEEIGAKCPKKAAIHEGIIVESRQLFGVIGWYYGTVNEHRRILLSSSLDNEEQEDALYILMLRHLKANGVTYGITEEELRELTQLYARGIKGVKGIVSKSGFTSFFFPTTTSQSKA